jgi:tetratricopeptide (TPR) repeat protein
LPNTPAHQESRALFQQALGFHQAGRLIDAVAAYDRVLAANPDDIAAWGNRGVALRSLGRLDEALASYDAAIARRPDHPDAYTNRGNVLVDLGRLDEARASLETACALKPQDATAQNNLGNALVALGRPDEALARLDAAIALKPDYPTARFNRSLALLAQGRFLEGWRDYDQRQRTAPPLGQWGDLATPEVRAAVRPGLTLSDVSGRHVLVVTEQGVGDVIMFASMLPDLIRVAGRVSLLCQPRLWRLVSTSFPGLTLVPSGATAQAVAEADHVLLIGSLGQLFRNRGEDFPKLPYLFAGKAVRDRWAARLGPRSARLRVGLSWRGGTPQTRAQDRSIPLADLRPLLDLPDCEFVSLQYGDPRAEIAEVNAGLSRPIRCFDPEEIDDFEDLAGLVRSLDVVVSVQTALVHVAGALGVPTLAMNRRVVPYRYGADPASMPWYGSVELIRQDETETWGPVIRQVAERLGRMAPADPKALFEAALSHHRAGDRAAALAAYDRVIAAAPGHFAAWGNRGVILRSLGRLEEALASYDAAIAIKPTYVDGHGNRGNALQDLGRYEEARASLETACALSPGEAKLHNNLGNALTSLGRPEEALSCYEAAIALQPDYTEALHNRGMTLLALDRFAEGWRDYDHRLRIDPLVWQWSGLVSPEIRAAVEPGLELSKIEGRRILVVAEQGVGDVIMFASMLPDLIKVAGQVSVLCQPRLWRLFAASFPSVILTPSDAATEAIASVDHVLLIGSLGRLFRNDLADFPKRPYLTASPAARAGWAQKLGARSSKLRVGLSWRGGTPQTGAQDRSIPLADLRPLLDLPDCEFVSLQYGDPRQEVAAVNADLARPIRCFDPQEIDDFEDLAGLVQSLDVIVSVQTALVHVAGALGVPTLAMNRRVVPYRYGRSTSTMPWYGSVELIRQDETETWGPVIRQVAGRLGRLAPADPQALFQQALTHHRSGDLPAAVAAYDRVIAADPEHFAAHGNRGVALRRLGRLDEALASYDAAIALKPDHADAYSNRGNLLQDQGRFDEARASLETARALRPGDATLQNNLGAVLLGLGRADEALARLDEAIALNPDYPTAQVNRGLALNQLDRFEEALACFEAGLAALPDDAKARAGRGKALAELRRDAEALPDLQAAAVLNPGDPEGYNMLGRTLVNLGRFDEAIAAFDGAVARAPEAADGRFNRSLALLTSGRMSEGWEDYERRWEVESYVRASAGLVSPALRQRLDPAPAIASLKGRRVLVASEQGMGDVIMFASMLPDLLAIAGEVGLLVQPRLRGLLAASFPDVALISSETEALAYDRVLGIASLGRLFRNHPRDFPGRPYLTARDAVRTAWAHRLGPPTTRLRIGLSWRGGTPKTGRTDRSIALQDLRPLLDLPDCEFVSLQYGDPRAEIADVNAGLSRPIRVFAPEETDDFEQLAGLAQAMDAIVSVQTALVHVAGAVGIPTLVLSRYIVPLSYGASRTATPWYPSVSLVSQDETGAWSPVIHEVADRLSRFTPRRSE